MRSAKRFPEAQRHAIASLVGDRGVAAVEFALVLPFFLMLVMGMIDYGYFFFLDLACTNAAREASRRGVVVETSSNVPSEGQAAGEAYLTSAGLGSGINVPTVVTTGPTVVSGEPLVTSTVTLDPFTPLVGFLPVLPSKIEVTSTMRYEKDLSP